MMEKVAQVSNPCISADGMHGLETRATSDRPMFEIHRLPDEDPAVYEMICNADTIGVFQIESRAQMSMLPRLRPERFYDLVIEVAIVRPGPIQGNMVHPYLQRRQMIREGKGEDIKYESEALRQTLAHTLGVPLFQEQAMRVVMVAANFTAAEADQLRRAMAAWRRNGVINTFYPKIINGMLDNGYTREFAERVFEQIQGFGEYGFPESHAASFAILVYVSAWIKRHHPAAFCAALLNSQPMGFYAPAQIVRDAREHGVTVLPPDVNESEWDCILVGATLESPDCAVE
jgi:error-prone DNA polymerase